MKHTHLNTVAISRKGGENSQHLQKFLIFVFFGRLWSKFGKKKNLIKLNVWFG